MFKSSPNLRWMNCMLVTMSKVFPSWILSLRTLHKCSRIKVANKKNLYLSEASTWRYFYGFQRQSTKEIILSDCIKSQRILHGEANHKALATWQFQNRWSSLSTVGQPWGQSKDLTKTFQKSRFFIIGRHPLTNFHIKKIDLLCK